VDGTPDTTGPIPRAHDTRPTEVPLRDESGQEGRGDYAVSERALCGWGRVSFRVTSERPFVIQRLTSGPQKSGPGKTQGHFGLSTSMLAFSRRGNVTSMSLSGLLFVKFHFTESHEYERPARYAPFALPKRAATAANPHTSISEHFTCCVVHRSRLCCAPYPLSN